MEKEIMPDMELINVSIKNACYDIVKFYIKL